MLYLQVGPAAACGGQLMPQHACTAFVPCSRGWRPLEGCSACDPCRIAVLICLGSRPFCCCAWAGPSARAATAALCSPDLAHTCTASPSAQYDNPNRPIYMYINSTGVVVSLSRRWVAQPGLAPAPKLPATTRCWNANAGGSNNRPCVQRPVSGRSAASPCWRTILLSASPPAAPWPTCAAEGQRQAGLRVGGLCHLRHDALHQAARGALRHTSLAAAQPRFPGAELAC